MKPWTVPDLLELGEAIAAAGLRSFVARRTLQRMERGEIAPLEAAEIIRRSSDGPDREFYEGSVRHRQLCEILR